MNNEYYLVDVPDLDACNRCIDEIYRKCVKELDEKLNQQAKEDTTMQVTCNGFTGELVKLERTFCQPSKYDLTLYNSEKQATISFTGVKMADLQFHGGAVTFGG